MSAHAQDRRRGHIVPGPASAEEGHTLGEEALHFTRWFMHSKYHLMRSFLSELRRTPGAREIDTLEVRYLRALTHALRVHRVRSVVTFLLALGVIAAAASAVANALDVAFPTGFLERAAAFSASVSVALVAMRLLLDRYLERVDVSATFLAIQLASAHPAR